MVRMQDCSWLRTKEVPVQLLILEARSCSPYMSLEDLSDYSDNSVIHHPSVDLKLYKKMKTTCQYTISHRR